jgi:hypothetical protein
MRLQCFVRPIAQDPVLGLLATTKINGFGFGRFVCFRRKSAAFMTTVTKGLIFTLTAGAPIVGFTRSDFNAVRGLLCNMSIHEDLQWEMIELKRHSFLK